MPLEGRPVFANVQLVPLFVDKYIPISVPAKILLPFMAIQSILLFIIGIPLLISDHVTPLFVEVKIPVYEFPANRFVLLTAIEETAVLEIPLLTAIHEEPLFEVKNTP